MASQQAKSLNNTNSSSAYSSQINLMGSTGSIQIPLSSGNALSGQAVNLPLPIPNSSNNIQSGAVSVQLPPGGSNVQLSGLPSNVPFHLSGIGQQGIHNSIIQLHRTQPPARGQQAFSNMDKQGNGNSSVNSGVGNASIQMSDHQVIPIQNGMPMTLKTQGATGSLSSSQVTANSVPLQLTNFNTSGNQVHVPVPVTTSNSQVRSNPRAGTQVLYVQKPTENTNTTTGGTPHIIVKRSMPYLPSVNTKPAIAPKVTTISKSSLLASSSSHPIVIQKPVKITPNMVPVSISPGGKHLYAPAYVNALNAIKKPGNSPKLSEGQSILVPASHLTGSTSTNKRFLTPMAKMQPAKFVLQGSSKGSVINFQIANGQIQNDPQGSVTVMRDLNTSVSDVPPLQPFSKASTNSSEVSTPTSTVVTQQTCVASDIGYTTSIPGSRAELIGEQEYALSIPETNSTMNEEVYTVSISDENNTDDLPEKSYTLSIPDKMSLLNKPSIIDTMQESVSAVPAILRRSNSDNVEKKNSSMNFKRRISLCVESGDEKNTRSEPPKSLLSSSGFSILNKNVSEEAIDKNNIPSLFCDEKLDVELDVKAVANDKESTESLQKNNGFTNIPRQVQINKDRRKSRISGDVLYQSKMEKKPDEKLTKPNKDMSVIDMLHDEDILGSQWKNRIAPLAGSSLQFQTNEFGLIDIVDSEEHSVLNENSSLKYHTPLKQRSERNGRERKPMSPEDLYCCEGCGCHGMAAEFITPNFCSTTCKVNFMKGASSIFRKKRKQKKVIMQKTRYNERDENMDDNREIINSDQKHFESFPSEVSAKLTTLEDIEIKTLKLEKIGPNPKYPWACPINGFSWMKYLEYHNAQPATAKLFKSPAHCIKNGFKVGMKLEAIDPVHPAYYAAVTVSEILGIRLKLHFDGFHEDFDFWVNCYSCDIFPPGWCERNGRVLRPPVGFTQATFSWPLYLKQVRAIAAPKTLFPHVQTNNINPTGFRIGMKLEAEDRKNCLTCVATVADIMDNRVLIHFDSWDDIYDYWVEPTSPYIHHVGWCDDNGYSLTPPNSYDDPENFTWDKYLKETNSTAVPPRAFKPRLPHHFTVGMKLEAVDKRVPYLVRVATITDVRSHQVRISFDGWPDALGYWVDDDHPDIHPVDWCRKTEHALEPPLSIEEFNTPGECGTGGCAGLGNSKSAKYKTHSSADECPYRLPPESPVLRDRLAGIRPPPLHTEPRPKEPRKLTITHRGRPPKPEETQGGNGNNFEIKERTSISRKRIIKHKKVEPEIKTEIMVSDEESNSSHSKRKRIGSPVTQEKVENSVYEPEYHPNPNWIAPPSWNQHCIPVDEILQRQTLRVDPRNWSQSDVQDFVEKVSKCRDLSWRFSKHRIDGESFLMLSQEDLVSILGMRLGPAIKVYNSIIQLRRKVTS